MRIQEVLQRDWISVSPNAGHGEHPFFIASFSLSPVSLMLTKAVFV
jgi:hypothetical protein